jgi:CMP-N-acetylneuraminic acid synthetase
MPEYLVLIPARAGSQRLPGKNWRELAGKPLISWTVEVAKEVFDPETVFVITDSKECSAIAKDLGVEWLPQDPKSAVEDLGDFYWVRTTLQALQVPGRYDIVLLRPTSPFRGPETIRRALRQWEACQPLDSLRAVRRASEHAYKQWVLEDWIATGGLEVLEWGSYEEGPIVTGGTRGEVFPTMDPITTVSAKKHLYEKPTQSLQDAYIQTGALEIFRAESFYRTGTLAGDRIGMFLTEGKDALDINDEQDWEKAEGRHE